VNRAILASKWESLFQSFKCNYPKCGPRGSTAAGPTASFLQSSCNLILMRNTPSLILSHPDPDLVSSLGLHGSVRGGLQSTAVAQISAGAQLGWGTNQCQVVISKATSFRSYIFVRYFHMCFIHLFWSKNTRYTLTVQEVIYIYICIWMHLRHVTEVQHQKGTSWQGMKGRHGKAQLSPPGWWWAAGAHFVLVHAEQVSCANWLFKRKDKPKNYTSEPGSKGWMPTNFAM